MFRRIDQLEMSIAAEKEPPATLPITEGSRASSHSSLDMDSIVGSHSNSTAAASATAIAVTASSVVTTTTLTQNSVPIIQQQAPMSDDEVCIL